MLPHSLKLKHFNTIFYIVVFVTTNLVAQTVTEQLYLSNPSQSLDLIDPVATGDTSTSQASLLNIDSEPITVNNHYFNKTSDDVSTITVPNVVVGTDLYRLMLVSLSVKGTDPDQIDLPGMTVTYGGQTVSPIDQTPDGNATVLLYALVNPPSGTADVVVNFEEVSKDGLVVGVTNFSGVNQTTPLGPIVKVQDIADTNLSLTVSSAPDELVYDVVAISDATLTAASTRQTILHNEYTGDKLYGASSIKPGAASVTMDWTSGVEKNNAMVAVAIKPVTSKVVTFIQSPAICNTLTIKGGQPITVSNYVSVISGSMPANPSITAELKYGDTNIITLSNPTYNSSTKLLTFTGSLGSDIAVPAGQAIALTITSSESDVSFYIDYDSQTKPSKIEFSMDSGSNIFPPDTPSQISGNTEPVVGSSQNYSVTNVSGLTYNWVLPTGWTQTAGANTNSITVIVGSKIGAISVTPSNGTCNGIPRILSFGTEFKQLYLTGSSQGLDRIDPVATGDATTSQTTSLSTEASVNLTATKDTWIWEETPDTNYGSCSSLITDREDGGHLRRILLEFDFSSIPAGVSILDGILKLNNTFDSGDLSSIGVYQLGPNDVWDEGTSCDGTGEASWNYRQSGQTWDNEGAIGDPGPTPGTLVATYEKPNHQLGIQTWDISTLVQGWIDGSIVNNGIAIWSPDGGGAREVHYDSSETTTGIPPSIGATFTGPAFTTKTFTQSTAVCSPLIIKAEEPITITNYISVTSGTMPLLPNIIAELKYGTTTFATISNPTYDSVNGTLTWATTLANDVIVPTGEAISLSITTAQEDVSFNINYDSQTAPSKIDLPVSTYIDIFSFDIIYDAPYPDGDIITSSYPGKVVYYRAVVTDPFGSDDITGMDIEILGTTVAAYTVATTSCSRTYEYKWVTPITPGTYDLTATAKEGYEGTITDSETIMYTLVAPHLDFDGVDDYVKFYDVNDITGNYTLEAWVLQEQVKPLGTIMAKRYDRGAEVAENARGHQLGLKNGFPRFSWYNHAGNAEIEVLSPFALTNNKWYHIAVTYNGTIAKLYIDGIEVHSVESTETILDSDQEFTIGGVLKHPNGKTPLHFFDGYIQEVRVWDVNLTEQQLHEMMNQRIEENTANSKVKGHVTTLDISGGLMWENLLGYYPLRDGTADDKSSNPRHGFENNMTTDQPVTAPLPYFTIRDGSWDDSVNTTSPWTYIDNWNTPNTTGIDGSTVIDWNIVESYHNVSIDRNTTVLGLVPWVNELSVLPDNSLTVSNYLKIKGSIDLEGESQLIQTEGSVLDEYSNGYLERDQQGTASSYNYNYWASPVSPQASGPGTNNAAYTIANVLRDGTNPLSPAAINFQPSAYAADNAGTTPRTLSSYWMYRFNGPSDDYNSWIHVGSTGALKTGEGFTLKGVDGTKAITDTQNYVFKGKPNNGTITLALEAGKDCLIGNPYASAIDATEFINDNLSTASGGNGTVDVFNGALYFWDHFATKTHLLRGYVGGYGTLNKTGGVKAVSTDARINANGSESNRRPGQYIPVTQGFFVVAEDGGTITFKNSQRIFEKEVAEVSVFLKSEQTKNTNKSNNYDLKIWLNFDLPSGYHRQLLLGEAEGATNNYDTGFDAPLIENNADDAYWYFDSDKYVIQGVPVIDKTQEFLIGIKAGQTGLLRVNLDDIQNDFENIAIYIKDNTTDEVFDIKSGIFETVLEAGEYNDRFSIVFEEQVALSVDEDFVLQDEPINIYVNQEDSMLTINRTNEVTINNVAIYNTLGQQIHSWNSNFDKNTIQLPVKLTKGVYIAIVKTNNKQYSKKLLIQN